MSTLKKGRIDVVTGCPGTGKTAIARRLAEEDSHGVLLDVDSFHASICHYVDPTRPESHHQNETVIRAAAMAAEGFAIGGYTAIVDGVIGPWFAKTFLESLSGTVPCRYVILHASLGETVKRASERPDADKFPIEGVRHMHKAFTESNDYTDHRISTDGDALAQSLAKVVSALASGRCDLVP